MYYSSDHLVTILNELLKRVSPAIFSNPTHHSLLRWNFWGGSSSREKRKVKPVVFLDEHHARKSYKGREESRKPGSM